MQKKMIEGELMPYFINKISSNSKSDAVVFLGGELLDKDNPCEFARNSNLFVCADKGAEHAMQLGLIPHAIIGDLDSVSSETLKYFAERNCKIIRNPDQESNDFEKILTYLLEMFESEGSSSSVFVFGMTGGRTDHTLANFSVMLRYTDHFENITAFEPGAEHRFLTTAKNNCKLEYEIGTTISLTPFGEANGIVTENLRYSLSNETLRLGVREGLSNLSTGSPVKISIDSGALLVSAIHNS